MKKTDAISNPAFIASRFCFPTSLYTYVFLSFEPSISLQPHSPLSRFDGAGDDTLPRVFHEIAKEDKGKKLVIGGFKSPPPIDVEDVKVNPLHMIFNLIGVLVGNKYFKINHLLPPSFNLARGHTLLGKSVVPRPTLKEFLLRSLK